MALPHKQWCNRAKDPDATCACGAVQVRPETARTSVTVQQAMACWGYERLADLVRSGRLTEMPAGLGYWVEDPALLADDPGGSAD